MADRLITGGNPNKNALASEFPRRPPPRIKIAVNARTGAPETRISPKAGSALQSAPPRRRRAFACTTCDTPSRWRNSSRASTTCKWRGGRVTARSRSAHPVVLQDNTDRIRRSAPLHLGSAGVASPPAIFHPERAGNGSTCKDGGAPSGTRTHTWRILSPLPLPIGLWGPTTGPTPVAHRRGTQISVGGADSELIHDPPSGTDIAIPSRMSCSLTTSSPMPARRESSSARTAVTIAPPPITSTRPGCMGPSAAR